MKFLIVGLKKNEQLTRLQDEAKKLGHEVEGVLSGELVIRCNRVSFVPSLRGKPMGGYDLIYYWTGKRRWEWYQTLEYLNKKHGVKIINNKIIEKDYNLFLSPASDYLKQTEENLLYPESAIVCGEKGAKAVIDKFKFPVILKASEGRQGKGVFKVGSFEELSKKILELKEISPSFVIREFIPNDGDVRIFTVGHVAIGAMKRTATVEGEFRSNISQGGKGEKFDLVKYPEVKRIAEKLSEITRTEIAGVDIMLHKETGQPYILEINPGPQFVGLEKYTGVNAAEQIVKYFEKVVGEK